MSAPNKPWEGNTQNNISPAFISGGDIVPTNGNGYRYTARVVPASTLPPLPPRHATRAVVPRMSAYGMSPYSSYGGYGMGSFGMGYPYGMRGQEFENRFIQLAEESAAPAFESIESFVRGFSAVTMMLESTYQAVHMSFRAVLSIAENMSRMRAAIFDFVSALTIFKTIYHFYRKVLHFLGLVNGVDSSWQEAERLTQGVVAETAHSGAAGKSVWPMFAFLGAIIAGPTLVYKYLLPNGVPEEEEVTLIATHDFEADQPGELSFLKGDRLLANKSQLRKGWILAKKGSAKGLIPSTRVKIIIRKSNSDISGQTVISKPTPPSSHQPIHQTIPVVQPIPVAQPALAPNNANPAQTNARPQSAFSPAPSKTDFDNSVVDFFQNYEFSDEALEKMVQKLPEDKQKKLNQILNPPANPNAQNFADVEKQPVQNSSDFLETKTNTPKPVETI